MTEKNEKAASTSNESITKVIGDRTSDLIVIFLHKYGLRSKKQLKTMRKYMKELFEAKQLEQQCQAFNNWLSTHGNKPIDSVKVKQVTSNRKWEEDGILRNLDNDSAKHLRNFRKKVKRIEDGEESGVLQVMADGAAAVADGAAALADGAKALAGKVFGGKGDNDKVCSRST